MGANAQTSVPLFVANSVLTAAQQNISAATGVPVFATTVTRDAAFGGSNKVLAEGQLCYLESTNVVQYYDGAAWVAVSSTPGMKFITSTAVSSTSFSINNCFSASYLNYRILFPVTVGTADQTLTFRMRVSGADNSTANYDTIRLLASNTVVNSARTIGATSWTNFLISDGASYLVIDIFNPFAAAKTSAAMNSGYIASAEALLLLGSWQQRQATSFDGFTISCPVTMTGDCYVYGYSLT